MCVYVCYEKLRCDPAQCKAVPQVSVTMPSALPFFFCLPAFLLQDVLVTVAPAFATRGPWPPFARSLPRAHTAHGVSSKAAIWGPDAGSAILGGLHAKLLGV